MVIYAHGPSGNFYGVDNDGRIWSAPANDVTWSRVNRLPQGDLVYCPVDDFPKLYACLK